jgi:hypothetical protein
VHRVFVDSNVLGSKTQYDWLFMLKAECEMFAVSTSGDVLDEAHRVWRRKHPDAGSEMRARRETLFRENFDEIVESWVGGEAPSLKDPHDAHVHNAARSSRVDILLTNNVADFGDPGLLPYDLYSPDDFFTLIETNDPDAVQNVTRSQALYWRKRHAREPDRKPITLADALRSAGCPQFALAVEAHLRVLAGLRVRIDESSFSSPVDGALHPPVVEEQVL